MFFATDFGGEVAERQYRKYRRYQGFKFKRTKTKMLPLLSDVVNGVVLGEPDAESMLYEVVLVPRNSTCADVVCRAPTLPIMPTRCI